MICVCGFQASAERNYHIFYQLCASRELPEMRSFKLGETRHITTSSLAHLINTLTFFFPDAPQHFRYTNRGGEMQIAGTDDLSDLERTRSAFTILGRDIARTQTFQNLLKHSWPLLVNMNVGSFVALKSKCCICLTCRCAA